MFVFVVVLGEAYREGNSVACGKMAYLRCGEVLLRDRGKNFLLSFLFSWLGMFVWEESVQGLEYLAR